MTSDDQSRNLAKSDQTYMDYGGKLKTSNMLNKQLKETHRKNRIRVYGSFYFFIAVVVYIWMARLGFFYFANLMYGFTGRLIGFVMPNVVENSPVV